MPDGLIRLALVVARGRFLMQDAEAVKTWVRRVELEPGESRKVTVTADPRLIARFDGEARQWRRTRGTHQITVSKAADAHVLIAEATLPERLFGS